MNSLHIYCLLLYIKGYYPVVPERDDRIYDVFWLSCYSQRVFLLLLPRFRLLFQETFFSSEPALSPTLPEDDEGCFVTATGGVAFEIALDLFAE